MLETLLEAILWKHFHLLRRILNNFNRINQSAIPSMLISVKGTSRVRCSPVRTVWEMLQCNQIALC